MSNGFPYWQFHSDRWLSGKINAFDLDQQGLYLHLCMTAWIANGAFNICSTLVQRRFNKSATWVDDAVAAFLDCGILVQADDLYRIKFIDDQLEAVLGKRERLASAGRVSAEKRAHEKANTEKTQNTNTEKRREEKNVEQVFNNCSTSVQHVLNDKEPENVPFKRDLYRLEFETFWKLYPRKVAKPQAINAFGKAMKRAAVEQIMDGLEKHAAAWAANTDKAFIPHPATWLNRDGWNDEVVTKPTPPPARGRFDREPDMSAYEPKPRLFTAEERKAHDALLKEFGVIP